MTAALANRLRREVEHGTTTVAVRQAEAGWNSPAGVMRRDRRAAFLVEGLPRSARVLEVGAGTGLQTVGLLAAFDDVTGIDISCDLLKIAERRAPGARYHVMDGHAPAFDEASFDAVVGVSILHHLNWEVAIAALFRLLRPRGTIRFSEPNLLNPQIYLQKTIPVLKRAAGDSPDEYAFTRWQIEQSLKVIGFIDIAVKPFEFLHPAMPKSLIPLILRIESWVSKTPLNEIAGSLLIHAKKP